jgi:hypothetical protein
MRATQPAHGCLVALTGAPDLPLGEYFAAPIVASGHFLPELAAQPEVPPEIRDIVYSDMHGQKGSQPNR